MKTLLFSFVFTACSFFLTASTTPSETVDSMEKQLTEMIQNSKFYKTVELEDATIMVKFTINEDNEVIVLSTDSYDYDSKIKSLLNYRNLDLDENITSKVFILPIRLEAN